MPAFIDACCNCHRVSLQTAMNHSPETCSKPVKAKHFQLMMNSADSCRQILSTQHEA
ncbi:hypothetical protein ACH50O_07335 [Methylomonas sp. 2BW1-5-20]|uniref:hypothetical protein n=1 Tax=Methylomonas sp. 2BW1-5-20 TaxID=3376686 RepID=UPI00404E5732